MSVNTITRVCPICKDDIPATAHKLKKLCGKKECMLEQARISGRKSYHKLLGHTKPEDRRCVVCSADITNLRGNRVVCTRPLCKETIVKRAKAEYHERMHGTAIDAERRRQAIARYRAKHRTSVIRVRKPRVERLEAPLSKPVKPSLDKRYQRKPKDNMKFIMRPKAIQRVAVPEDDVPWTPKVFNIPQSVPVHTASLLSDKPISSFNDPWECAACRAIEQLCRLHKSMTNDGSMSTKVGKGLVYG